MFNKVIITLLPFMPRNLVWLFSKKYIAGTSINDAIKVSRELNSKGLLLTLDILGEFINDLEQARNNRDEYLVLIEEAEKNNINGNYSLKPSSFGLLIDEEATYLYVKEIVAKAASFNNFVRIDMEDSKCVDKEIRLFSRLYEEFPENVGLVIQAYLRRSHSDLKNMSTLKKGNQKLNFRLCKGIYVEDESVAYKDFDEINANYLRDLDYMFSEGMYPAIATHDKSLIEGAFELIKKYNANTSQYEFQMLYGVSPILRQAIIDKGHRLRVYIPFGKDWYAYSIRRLKENPKIANHIFKALFVRN